MFLGEYRHRSELSSAVGLCRSSQSFTNCIYLIFKPWSTTSWYMTVGVLNFLNDSILPSYLPNLALPFTKPPTCWGFTPLGWTREKDPRRDVKEKVSSWPRQECGGLQDSPRCQLTEVMLTRFQHEEIYSHKFNRIGFFYNTLKNPNAEFLLSLLMYLCAFEPSWNEAYRLWLIIPAWWLMPVVTKLVNWGMSPFRDL